MFHNIDRPAVLFVVIVMFLYCAFIEAKYQVRKALEYYRLQKALDKNVDDPANIEALARSIGMKDTNKH